MVHFMYCVVHQLDGSYLSLLRIQDGTERSTHQSRDEAVRSLISGAKIMNGSTISEHDVRFGQEKQVVKTEIFWDEPKKCCHCNH